MNEDELIFDSLAHPTPDGTWMDRPVANTFEALVEQLRSHHFAGACAVGMWGIDGWDPARFADRCRAHSMLFPVAGYKPRAMESMAAELGELVSMGYRGIKLHSRFSRFDVADPWLPLCFQEAARLGLVVFWCTFHHTSVASWPSRDPLSALVSVLQSAPDTKVVLLHGGDVDLLRYMQLVRFNPRLILDLSHTIAKYPGSSMDSDISFLCSHFDRHICVGTDWPQFSHQTLRELFQRHTARLPSDKRANIAHRNLMSFLGLDA